MIIINLRTSPLKFILYKLPLLFSLFGLAIFQCKLGKTPDVGKFIFISGMVQVEHSGQPDKKNQDVKLNDSLNPGDVITTGPKSLAIVEIPGAKIEIQANTKFHFKLENHKKTMFLDKGSVWTKVQKQKSGEQYQLVTPTTVAGVRGTKFYTMIDGETVGTCHCEGKIEFENTISGQSAINDTDYLMFYSKNISIKFTMDELVKAGLPGVHAHSMIDNSILGPKVALTPEQNKLMQNLIKAKFEKALSKNL